MKVKNPAHKVLLRGLFYNKEGAVNFSVDKLADAGSALKKLEECTSPMKDKEGKEIPNMIEFNDVEVTFSPAEIAILKPLFDGKEEWDVTKYEVVGEVKALFDGKEAK